MKYARMTYSQEYIDTLWCEFHIEPTADNDFAISAHHLHIWPGKDHMFIAIPSVDKSFTCTLFLPASHFDELDAYPSSLISFFNDNFPGVADTLIPSASLKQQYDENPHLPLISIKCAPHTFGSSVAILGDAAHAMVPFYGQGMNAGLEDVRVLFEHLDAHPSTPQGRTTALASYTEQRTPDAHAINDLALRNYQEMRADVTSPAYRLRKWVEEKMSVYLPSLGFATQYSRVSFGNMRYSEVEAMAQKQGRVLLAGMAGFVGVLLPFMGYGAWALWRWNKATGTGRTLAKRWVDIGNLAERFERLFV